MVHFEAVLRIAVGQGTAFTLQSFYKTRFVAEGFRNRRVRLAVPEQVNIVADVDDFSDRNMPEVLRLLRLGFIVVSKAHSEVGVEYLAPFVDATTTKLIVACVQCKFVVKSTSWTDIADKMLTATKYLRTHRQELFPVVYTTVDQRAMAESTFSDGVYFTETELFSFTSPLGVLRMHMEKLGAIASQAFPFLARRK